MRNKLTSTEIKEIEENEGIIFTTSFQDVPRSIIVLPSRVEENQIIISDIQMNKSIENVKKNPHCFINAYIQAKDGKQIKMDCTAEVYSEGELFQEIKKMEEMYNLPPELNVHSIIVAKITNVDATEE